MPKKGKKKEFAGSKLIINHEKKAKQLVKQRKDMVKSTEDINDDFLPDFSEPVVNVQRNLKMSVLCSDTVDAMFDRKALEEFDECTEPTQDVPFLPCRPSWKESFTDPALLAKAEEDSFLRWRKLLDRVHGNENITPYEKNLNLWRQLWHVMEKTNILCQVLDCRDPLFYFNMDLLEHFLKLSKNNKAIVLLNKADLLSQEQRKIWQAYFNNIGVPSFFWSNSQVLSSEENKGEDKLEEALNDDSLMTSLIEDMDCVRVIESSSSSSSSDVYNYVKVNDNEESDHSDVGTYISGDDSWENFSSDDESHSSDNECDILNPEDFITAINELCGTSTCLLEEEVDQKYIRLSIGMVGFPNVGKSSTINSLIGAHKIGISSTPGKTKHFQNFHLNETVELIDCPGLVFPSYCDSNVDLTLSGVVSADNLRNTMNPVIEVCRRIPRKSLEQAYNIGIPQTKIEEWEYCTAEEFASAVAYTKGHKVAHKVLNLPSACKVIIKDYISGKLLYCRPPPDTCTDKEFNQMNVNTNVFSKRPLSTEQRSELCAHILRESTLVSEFEVEANNERRFLAKTTPVEPNVKDNRALKIGHSKKKKQKLRKKYKGFDGIPYDV